MNSNLKNIFIFLFLTIGFLRAACAVGAADCVSSLPLLSQSAARNVQSFTELARHSGREESRINPGDWSEFSEVMNYQNSKVVQDMLQAAYANAAERSAAICWGIVRYNICRPNDPEIVDVRNRGKYLRAKFKTFWRRGKKHRVQVGPQIPPAVAPGRCEEGSLLGPHQDVPTNSDAKDTLKTLLKADDRFVNMLKDPRYKGMIRGPKDAPLGSLVVYEKRRDKKGRYRSSCKNNPAGHIEIRGEDGYYSDFKNSHSVMRDDDSLRNRCYKVTGVLIRNDMAGEQ